MSANDWEPWLSAIEHALDDGDGPGMAAALKGLDHFPFHEHGGQEPARWDRLFSLLLRLLGHGEEGARRTAYHYVFVTMWLERGAARSDEARQDRARQAARRTVELLPALAPLVHGRTVSLLRCTDDLVHTEGLVNLGPQETYRRWIDSVTEDPSLALAARIAYLDGRGPWESAGESLTGLLDHQDDMVRAYAARALGRRYLLDADEPTPLREMVATLTAKEIERPGIAGPFFSNWYGDGGVEELAREAGVTRRTLTGAGADLFVNLSPLPGGGSYAYSAVLYPLLGGTFDEPAAACLEIVLPQSMRGEMLPYGMPGYDVEPGLYLRERSAHARYRCGALVEHHGDVAARRWEWIRILWHGPAGAWRPETLAS